MQRVVNISLRTQLKLQTYVSTSPRLQSWVIDCLHLLCKCGDTGTVDFLELDLAIEILTTEDLGEAAHTVIIAGVDIEIDLGIIVAINDTDGIFADTLKSKPHHFNIKVLGLGNIDGAVHASGIKAAQVREGEKLDFVGINIALEFHGIAEFSAEHVADLAVKQLFIAGAGVKTKAGSAGCGAGVGEHDDFINLVGFQQLEHVSQSQIAFASTGRTAQHGDLVM